MRLSLSLWTLVAAIALSAIGCATQHPHNLPPAERLLEPGPGVGGPGPGVLPPVTSPMAAMGGLPGLPGMAGPGMVCAGGVGVADASVQVLFAKPDGMNVQWDTGTGAFDSQPLVVPGRQNFPQGGIYLLKITNIEGREGVELYPTLEIGPITPRTEAYLAHNAIPVQFTEEDFDQVMSGNFVTKVIYLPDPEFQEMALAGVETLVSTRLDPGVDPIVEADRRGSIMAVIRLGNKDIEMPEDGYYQQYGEATDVMPASYGNISDAGVSISPTSANTPVYSGAVGMGVGMYGGMPVTMGPTGLPPNYISGVTAPQWGMPYTGTPIGLVGPPHIPLGAPAGLQRHVMRNHTSMHIPEPSPKFKIHVRETPGMSYPRPPSRMHVREQHIHPPLRYNQPYYDMLQPVH